MKRMNKSEKEDYIKYLKCILDGWEGEEKFHLQVNANSTRQDFLKTGMTEKQVDAYFRLRTNKLKRIRWTITRTKNLMEM